MFMSGVMWLANNLKQVMINFKKKKNQAYLLYIGFLVMDYVMVLVRLEWFPL